MPFNRNAVLKRVYTSVYPLSNLLWAWSTSCENTLITFAERQKSWWKGKGRRRGMLPFSSHGPVAIDEFSQKKTRNAGRDYILSKITDDLRSLVYPVLFFCIRYLMHYLFLYLLNSLFILIRPSFAPVQLVKYFLAIDETSMTNNVSIKYIHSLNRYKKRIIFKNKL